jgi:hypothetical protein
MTRLFSCLLVAGLAAGAAAQESAVLGAEAATPVPEAQPDTPRPEIPESDAVLEEGDPPVATEPPALVILDAAGVDLAQFLWTSRPILVFADTPADPRFIEQMELLESRPAELIARDVVVIVDTDPGARSMARLRLRPRGFQMALIGKDGDVNLRKPFPWDVREITRAIDKWPLRQEEIRARRAGD